MDVFSQYYQSLLAYAGAIIRNHNLSLDSTDLVNDAYIKFIEIGGEFEITKLKKIISDISQKELGEKCTRFGLGTQKKLKTSFDQICCTICNEIKPANAFPMENRKGHIYIRRTCKNCRANLQRPRSRTYYYKRISNSLITQELNNKSKNYCRRQCSRLTDVYIIKLLKKTHKDICDESILNKRKELDFKRFQRRKKK